MDFIKLFAPLGIASHVFLRNDRYFTPSFDVGMSRMLTEHLSSMASLLTCKPRLPRRDGSLAKTIGGGALPLHALTAGVLYRPQEKPRRPRGRTATSAQRINQRSEHVLHVVKAVLLVHQPAQRRTLAPHR